MTALAPTSEQQPGAGPAEGGAGSQRGRWAGTYLPMVPFFAYVALFLLLPTADRPRRRVPIGRRIADPREHLDRPAATSAILAAFVPVDPAVARHGAHRRDPRRPARLGGRRRRAGRPAAPDRRSPRPASWPSSAASCSRSRSSPRSASTASSRSSCRTSSAIDLLAGSTWLYGMTGLAVVYTYFQIPLMVIVFLPALDGLRQEW